MTQLSPVPAVNPTRAESAPSRNTVAISMGAESTGASMSSMYTRSSPGLARMKRPSRDPAPRHSPDAMALATASHPASGAKETRATCREPSAKSGISVVDARRAPWCAELGDAPSVWIATCGSYGSSKRGLCHKSNSTATERRRPAYPSPGPGAPTPRSSAPSIALSGAVAFVALALAFAASSAASSSASASHTTNANPSPPFTSHVPCRCVRISAPKPRLTAATSTHRSLGSRSTNANVVSHAASRVGWRASCQMAPALFLRGGATRAAP